MNWISQVLIIAVIYCQWNPNNKEQFRIHSIIQTFN